jgi:hypothetical protein
MRKTVTTKEVKCEYLPVAKFREWLEDARPGDVIVYLIGDLAHDEHKLIEKGHPEGGAVEALASETLKASGALRPGVEGDRTERVFLSQRRLEPKRFEYRATRIAQDTAAWLAKVSDHESSPRRRVKALAA